MPRLIADISRPLGRLKVSPEDFVVHELPAYLPCDEGEHLFLWLEKRDLPAEQLLRHLARTLEISQSEIGCAGMKDRRAITRQWISVPAAAADRVPGITNDRVTVLEVHRHRNKLRTGHLAGNRFSILVRDVVAVSGERDAGRILNSLQPAIAQLQQLGLANYYGDQRFGRNGETLALGYDLLAGRRTPRDIPYSRRKFLLRLALSSAQSDLFNQALAARIRDGLAARVFAGDVMEVVASGGKFVVEDADAEQVRCDAGEVALTGPMFGTKMKMPAGIPAEREQQLLRHAGLTMASFTGFGDLLAGTRRRYTIRPEDLSVSEAPEGIRLQFALPPGVYATTLIDELFDTRSELEGVPEADNE